jgi:O-antigen ligase
MARALGTDALGPSARRRAYAIELVYLLLGSLILVLLSLGRFPVAARVLPVLIFLLGATLVGEISKNLLYLALLATAIPIKLFTVPLVGQFNLNAGVNDVIILALLLLMAGYHSRRGDAHPARNFLTLPLIVLSGAALLSFFGATDARLGIIMLLMMAEGFILYRYVLTCFRSERDLRNLLTAFLALTFFASFTATVQYIFGSIPFIGAIEIKKVFPTEVTRVAGLLTHPNSLAGFLVLALPLALISFERGRKFWNAWVGFTVLTSVIALAVTFSRNGYLAFIAGLLTLTILYLRRTRRRAVLLVLALGLPVLLGIALAAKPEILGRLLSIQYYQYDVSTLSRFFLWKGGVEAIARNPLLGAGIGNFFFEPYSLGYTTAHNLYIQTFVELGLLGFVGVIWFLVRILRNLRRACRSARSDFLWKVSAGLFTSWIAFLVHNTVDCVWYCVNHPIEIKIFGLFLGLTALCVRLSTGTREART